MPTLSDSAILLAIAVAVGWETAFDVTSVSCDDCPYQPQCPPTCHSLNPEIALWGGQWIMRADCLTQALMASLVCSSPFVDWRLESDKWVYKIWSMHSSRIYAIVCPFLNVLLNAVHASVKNEQRLMHIGNPGVTRASHSHSTIRTANALSRHASIGITHYQLRIVCVHIGLRK
jgi:hypothetical protein